MNQEMVETASGLVVPASAVPVVVGVDMATGDEVVVRYRCNADGTIEEIERRTVAPRKDPRRPISVGDVFVLDGVPFRVRKTNGKKHEVLLRVAREVRDVTIRNPRPYVDSSGGRD